MGGMARAGWAGKNVTVSDEGGIVLAWGFVVAVGQVNQDGDCVFTLRQFGKERDFFVEFWHRVELDEDGSESTYDDQTEYDPVKDFTP